MDFGSRTPNAAARLLSGARSGYPRPLPSPRREPAGSGGPASPVPAGGLLAARLRATPRGHLLPAETEGPHQPVHQELHPLRAAGEEADELPGGDAEAQLPDRLRRPAEGRGGTDAGHVDQGGSLLGSGQHH